MAASLDGSTGHFGLLFVSSVPANARAAHGAAAGRCGGWSGCSLPAAAVRSLPVDSCGEARAG